MIDRHRDERAAVLADLHTLGEEVIERMGRLVVLGPDDTDLDAAGEAIKAWRRAMAEYQRGERWP